MLCTVYSGHRLATVRPDRLEQLLIACAQRGEVPWRKIKRRNGARILTPREKRSPHRETPWKKSSVYQSRGTVCSAAGNPAACASYTRGHLRRHGTHRAPVYPPCTTSVRSAAMRDGDKFSNSVINSHPSDATIPLPLRQPTCLLRDAGSYVHGGGGAPCPGACPQW